MGFLNEHGHGAHDKHYDIASLILEIAFLGLMQVSWYRMTVKSISMLLTTAHKISPSIT